MTFPHLLVRHLARNWLAYLLLALAAGMLLADLSGPTGVHLPSHLAGSGLAAVLAPGLLVCALLCVVGVRLDATRRDLDQTRDELARAQALGRIANWTYRNSGFEWAPQARAVFGIGAPLPGTLEQLLKQVAPDDRGQLERAWRAAMAGTGFRVEVAIPGDDGVRHVLLEGRCGVPSDAASGVPDSAPGGCMSGVVQDVTGVRRLEGELRQAMRYQRALLDNFPFMVWVKDRNLRYLAANKPLARAGGRASPEEVQGLLDHDMWPGARSDAYRADDLAVLDSRKPRGGESVIDAGAHRKVFDVWKAPVFDDDSELLGIVGFARDISERKRVEAALERSRLQIAALGELQARFVAGEPADTLFAAMLQVIEALSGCADGFIADVVSDARARPHVNVLARRDIDWLNERADLIDTALGADGSDCESGAPVAADANGTHGRGLVCIAVMNRRRLVGLVGLASGEGRIDDDRMEAVRTAVSTLGLMLEAMRREHARVHAETELTRHRARMTGLVEEQLSDSISARRQAEQANRAKSRFLASMSHELRTPIHAILGFARLALRDRPPLSDTTRHRFQVIRQNGDRLLALVDDLLDLSRLEGAAVHLNIAPCNIDTLAREALADMAPMALERDVRMSVSGEVAEPVINADGNRLAEVLRKLLDNGIRLSPQSGEVVIALSAQQHDGVDGVLLQVSDDGPGIPEADLEKIFDQFTQAERLRGHAGGTGLGLAVCREVIKLHHGWIRASNRPQGGASIGLWLPYRR
jgi:PAS domain S-box-containing protein